MAEQVALRAEPRSLDWKGERRRLRRQGMVPAILYGKQQAPRPIQFSARELEHALHQHGHSALFDLTVNGERATAVIKEVQHDPITGRLSHLGLQRVSLEDTITASVPLVFVGDTSVIIDEGGVIQHPASEVTVSCRADHLPESITVDVSGLRLGDSLRVADLTPPEGVTITTNPEQVVAATSVSAAAREEAAAEEAAAAAEAAAAEAPAEAPEASEEA
jgi:large subunit ribosomal protein L25